MGIFKVFFSGVVIFGGLVAVGMYILFKFLVSFPPGRARREDELKKLKAEIDIWTPDLIDWDADELEQLSLNQINKEKSGGLRPTGKGIFTSIYQEPMIAYAYRKYQGKEGGSALVYAQTACHEYAFSIKNDQTEIWLDGQPLGTFRKDGILVAPNSSRELARIKKSSVQKMLPIYINDREVASLIHPDRLSEINPRAFDLVKQMSKEEESILLALAVNHMVKTASLD